MVLVTTIMLSTKITPSYLYSSFDLKRIDNLPELGIYIPYSSARVNERALPLSLRSCREPGSNWQSLGHESSTVPQSLF